MDHEPAEYDQRCVQSKPYKALSDKSWQATLDAPKQRDAKPRADFQEN